MNLDNGEFLDLTKEIIERGELVRFTPVGGSMYPFIRSKEAIHIAPLNSITLRYADIILFCDREKRLQVHRIVKRRKARGRITFVAKGDSLRRSDGNIEEEAVIGRVVAIEKGGRLIFLDKGVFRLANILYTLCLPVSRWAYILFERCVKKTY
jgi:hypothetical protein